MKGYRMVQLTSEKAKEWKAEKWNHAYTLWQPKKCEGLLGVSGRYFYQIKFTGKSELIQLSKVPRSYREFLKSTLTKMTSNVWRTPAELVKVWKREGMD